jgi:hypothetical protein
MNYHDGHSITRLTKRTVLRQHVALARDHCEPALAQQSNQQGPRKKGPRVWLDIYRTKQPSAPTRILTWPGLAR